jgi:hypothetical protein
MRAILVIVLEVGTHQPNEMVFVENHYLLEELPPTAADPAFGHQILPRTPVRRSRRFGVHGLHESHHRRTEYRVLIEYEILRRGVVRERLAQLLDYPGGRGIGCDVEVHDWSLAMLDNKQHVEHPQGGRRYGEEVHRCDGVLVISQECNRLGD